jgi:microcystin-dependent protein
MADTFTNFWGLAKPEPGASRDTWGTKLNADLDALDALLQALQPIGAMTDFAGSAAPIGWLLCDGTIYNIADYPRLFAVIINAYGGDGVSTFAVPDLRARATVGVGVTIGDLGYSLTIALGQKIGDAEIPLGQANLPNTPITTSVSPAHVHAGSVSDLAGPHSHPGTTDAGGTHDHGLPPQVNWHSGGQDAQGGFDNAIAFNQRTYLDGNHAHTFNTDYAGSHQHSLAISADGVHSHTFSLGGTNTPVRIVPPMFGTTKIICCGPPSMQTLQSGAAPSSNLRLLASPMRGLH